MYSFSHNKIIQHWLLNTAVEFGVPLTYIFPEVSSLNVMPVPGCDSGQYASALIELFDSGMITFSSEVEEDDTRIRPSVLRILDRFRTLSNEDSDPRVGVRPVKRLPGVQLSFKLTALGGEAWEKIARPDWAHYVRESTIFPGTDLEPIRPVTPETPGDGDLVSADCDRIIAYMGWYPEVRGEKIETETIQWETHTDFHILYWKRLPFVHHASFRVRFAEGCWHGTQPKWFKDWWVSTHEWYTKPWNLPDWPSK